MSQVQTERFSEVKIFFREKPDVMENIMTYCHEIEIPDAEPGTIAQRAIELQPGAFAFQFQPKARKRVTVEGEVFEKVEITGCPSPIYFLGTKKSLEDARRHLGARNLTFRLGFNTFDGTPVEAVESKIGTWHGVRAGDIVLAVA